MPNSFGQAGVVVRIAGITHQAQLAIPTEVDTGKVRPPEWNDDHVITGGTHGQIMVRDTTQATGFTWVSSGGSDALTPSFAGYSTIGGTWTTMTNGRMLCKQITVGTDSLVTSIDAYVRGNNDAVGSAAVVILTDNAGVPHHLLGGSYYTGVYLSNSASMPTDAGWLAVPVNRWLTAGTYWICFMGSANWQIANDGSGSDQYFAPSGGAVVTGTYPSAWAITTGTVTYSIRATIRSVLVNSANVASKVYAFGAFR